MDLTHPTPSTRTLSCVGTCNIYMEKLNYSGSLNLLTTPIKKIRGVGDNCKGMILKKNSNPCENMLCKHIIVYVRRPIRRHVDVMMCISFPSYFSDFEQKGVTVTTGDEGKTGRGRAKNLLIKFQTVVSDYVFLTRKNICWKRKYYLFVMTGFTWLRVFIFFFQMALSSVGLVRNWKPDINKTM